MAKFGFHVSTDNVGSEIEEIVEIDDKSFEDKDRNAVVEEHYNEWLWDNIETWWKELEDADNANQN